MDTPSALVALGPTALVLLLWLGFRLRRAMRSLIRVDVRHEPGTTNIKVVAKLRRRNVEMTYTARSK